MGRQEKCKALRKKLFNVIDKKDRQSERKYEQKEIEFKNAFGAKATKSYTVSTGLHRQYRILKNEKQKKK